MYDGKEKTTPVSNRGVVNTLPKSPIACVDWFSCTFFSARNWQELAALFRFPLEKFTVKEKGINGYLKSAIWDNIEFYFEGHNDSMGIWLNLGGQGCRQFEELFEHTKWTWIEVFEFVLEEKANVTRLDIAIDDFNNIFTIHQLELCMRNGCVASRFKHGRNFEKINLETGKTEGQTLYFGQSEVIFRFYDKYYERLQRGKYFHEDIKTWVRSEVQLRGNRAKAALDVIVNNDMDLGDFLRGLLNRYIAFKVKGNDTNRARWKNTRWWDKFLNNIGKIKLSLQAPDKSVLRTKDWIDKQVLASLATLYISLGSDDKLFNDYIIEKGKSQMSDHQLQMALEFANKDDFRNQLKADMVSYIQEKKSFSKQQATNQWLQTAGTIIQYNNEKKQQMTF